MLIGSVGALVLGMWAEAAILIFVYSLGDVLESYAVDKARGAIRSLMNLAPKQALVRKEGQEVILSVDEINVGDSVIVKAGERIPVDGTVQTGSSFVDQSTVTGESFPVTKNIGDMVFAGTINQKSFLEVRVDKPASETMLSKIIYSVEEAQAKKISFQRFSDKFSNAYTPAMFVLGIAIAVIPPLLFGAEWMPFILRGLVVFVVSCSCGLALSVPVAVVAAMANAARKGVVFKGGAYFEAAKKVKVIAFDKTGTLTIGRPEVTDVISFDNHSQRRVVNACIKYRMSIRSPSGERYCKKSKGKQHPQLKPILRNSQTLLEKALRQRLMDNNALQGAHAFCKKMKSQPTNTTIKLLTLRIKEKPQYLLDKTVSCWAF